MRILILASASRDEALRRPGGSQPEGAFGDLERSIQLANLVRDPNYARVIVIDADDEALDFVRRTSKTGCEVDRISSVNDLAEIHHHVAVFAPQALAGVSLHCSERLSHLALEPGLPVWCDVARVPLYDPAAMERLDRILYFGDRFSASSAFDRGALLGRLSAIRRLDPGLETEQVVVEIGNDYELLFESRRGRHEIHAGDSDSKAAFRVLAASLCTETTKLVESAVAIANRSLGDQTSIELRALDSISRGPLPHRKVSLVGCSDLVVLAAPQGAVEEVSAMQLREEIVSLGLPVLSLSAKVSGALPFGSRFGASELAEKLVWAVGHRSRLEELTREEAAAAAVAAQRTSGPSSFEQWLESPTRMSAFGADDCDGPDEIAEPPMGALARVKRWLTWL